MKSPCGGASQVGYTKDFRAIWRRGAGQVVIKFPSDHTPELRKRIRSAGFCTKGPRRAFRLRKVSGGVNSALEDARGLVREILGGD